MLKFKVVSPYADVFLLDEFISKVEDGTFIEDDGYGNIMFSDTGESNVSFWRSYPNNIPKWATHVAWYNR